MSAAENTNVPMTAERVIALLHEYAAKKPAPSEWDLLWLPLMFNAKLGALGTERVFDALVALEVGGKRALATEFKIFRAGQAAKKIKAEGEARRASSKKVVVDMREKEEMVITKIEQALVEAKDPELPLMRDLNGYVRPVCDRPAWGKCRVGQPIPTIAMLAPHTEASLRWGIDRHIELASGDVVVKSDNCAVRLLQNPLQRAPVVRGMITHPLVRADGRLIDAPGLDADSGLYVHLGGKLGLSPPFVAPPIPIPDHPAEAQKLAAQYAQEMLGHYADYRFENHIDMVVALSARLTLLTRKDLDIAPCFLLVGPERGTGKTTLAAIDHVIATGHDIPAASLEEDSEKAKQTLFAAFSSSPAAVLFDNLPASECYGSDVLAQALTKGVVKARRFHAQTEVQANTNVQLYFTGNAVTLNEDLQARTLEVRFAAERPTKWSHPDWLVYARSIREEVRTKLQFIQRSYIRHGIDKVEGVYTRFPEWGRRVRDPLLWAGLPDVGARFQDLEDKNPNRAVDAGVVAELQARCADEKFTAGEIVSKLEASLTSDTAKSFRDLRSMLQERWPRALGKSGPQFLGQYFREHLKRWLRMEDGSSLRLVDTAEKGHTRWRVEIRA